MADRQETASRGMMHDDLGVSELAAECYFSHAETSWVGITLFTYMQLRTIYLYPKVPKQSLDPCVKRPS